MRNLKRVSLFIVILSAASLLASCGSSSKPLEERVSQLEETDEVALARQTSTTTGAVCTACKCKVTGLNCQCSIQKQYDCLKDGGPKKPRLAFDENVKAK